MRFPRASGIILHPTCLPGRYGIGDFGRAAIEFLDWLAEAGQKVWQVLPLGPTGYGDSPYQLFSAFAGNPLLIDLEELVRDGVLSRTELEQAPAFPEDAVDFGHVIGFKLPLLGKAAREFYAGGPSRDFVEFTTLHQKWLDDYALFMAVKSAHGGVLWSRWEPGIRARRRAAIERWTDRLAEEIAAQKYFQYVFFRQWAALRRCCRERGIRVLGDVPIYVSHDSADVWAHPDLFELDEAGEPRYVSGVPPDYFSATGQLWGNPIYRWGALAENGYGWWMERVRATLAMVDLIRLDHFRGFEAYWRVPAGETTAIHGEWVPGPGMDFFETAEKELGELPLIAENLGVITPGVEAIRERFGFPGMSVLQFAFGKDPQGPDFRPHNYPRERVAYTGTHDNDTTIGWWTSTPASDSTRSAQDIAEEREFACKYLGTDGREINWVLIRAALASVADTALYPLQDVLGLGSDARMNLPGRPAGNWRWRYRSGMLRPELARRLREMVRMYGR